MKGKIKITEKWLKLEKHRKWYLFYLGEKFEAQASTFYQMAGK